MGSEKPEDFGDYYAWGETETKDNYDWSTYKFGTSYSGPFSKYNMDDKKTSLETGPNGDDVVSKRLGGKWRIPTKEEWEELKSRCTLKWTSDYNGTGVPGIIATSIVSANRSEGLFFPATSSGESFYDCPNAKYWSSSIDLYPKCEFAYGVNLVEERIHIEEFPRSYGFSIRPVSE